jgi:hypothetical protein
MSRTYRRKNEYWNFPFYDYTWDSGYLKKIRLNLNSKEYKQKKARFHSDNYTGWCVPHWYVNMFFERTNRRKAKREIQKWMNNPENYEVLLKPHIKNAGWNYW